MKGDGTEFAADEYLAVLYESHLSAFCCSIRQEPKGSVLELTYEHFQLLQPIRNVLCFLRQLIIVCGLISNSVLFIKRCPDAWLVVENYVEPTAYRYIFYIFDEILPRMAVYGARPSILFDTYFGLFPH